MNAKIQNPALTSPFGKPRARGLELPLPGTPGPFNAITDVADVEVGYETLIRGDAIGCHGDFAAAAREAAQSHLGGHLFVERQRRDDGLTLDPRRGLVYRPGHNHKYIFGRHRPPRDGSMDGLPVCVRYGEICLGPTGRSRDLRRLAERHCGAMDRGVSLAAIDAAQPGAVNEGNVGGGTGMICYEFKGGTGTASRRVEINGNDYIVGVLVQANHGIRDWLTVCGVRVGDQMRGSKTWTQETGSIIALIATDAPLLPTQLERMARRASIGVGRGGTPSGNNSGDIFLAFTTVNDPGPLPEKPRYHFEALGNETLDPLFLATVESVEEAALNVLIAAETMTGKSGRVVEAIDHERLVQLVAREPAG